MTEGTAVVLHPATAVDKARVDLASALAIGADLKRRGYTCHLTNEKGDIFSIEGVTLVVTKVYKL